MSDLRIKTLLAGCVFLAATGAANAGGLERGGYNIDLLFDPSRFASEAAVTYVMPERDLNNVDNNDVFGGLLNSRPANGIRDTESYAVPRVGLKAGFGENVDCLVDYSQPWGAHSNPGVNWAGAVNNIETKIDSDNYGATCSFRMDAGKGQFRILGGVFYQEVSGFKERLVSPLYSTGIGRLELEGDGVGWRIGAAYEITEIALRASLVYNSKVDLGDITGTLDLSNVNPRLPTPIPVVGNQSMPDMLEFKLQSGIAPGWLAFGSVKWVNWSMLQAVPFYCVNALTCPTGTAPITTLALLYQDGWTVTGGVAHKFNDMWSLAGGITWDRGTMTDLGTSTDTWTFAAGASFTPNDNVEIRFGGALGILTAGASTNTNATLSQGVTYDYGDDFVGALNVAARLKF